MKKAIMSILIVWILVCGIFVGLIGFVGIEYVKAPYTPHNPIRINSDAEFASMAGIEGWVGDGSPGNPYIIEGYDINGSGYGYCIYIGNTTDYFEVRDCYLHEASGVYFPPFFPDSGLILYYVQNGTITNNTVFSNSNSGVRLQSSTNNIIVNNNLSSNFYNSIALFSSNNNTINNNNASNNDYGIHLNLSNSNTIVNNTASSNNHHGIYLWNSDINSITNNTASDNGYDGINLYSSNNNIIANNTAFSNDDYGTRLYESKNNTLTSNNVSLNNIAGIFMDSSSGNTITNNTSSNNRYGISLFRSISNVITNNTVFSNIDWGIRTSSSSGNTITNNTSSNNFHGIYLYSSNNSTITNNTVFSNSDYGIYLYTSSNDNIIAYNNASSNKLYGIYISDSSDNNIYYNYFFNNTDQAYDDTNNGNQWDKEYPLGGNYWSDYSGIDNFKGPNQDIPGSDGIGDTPYIIDADSQDNYPLMEPYTNRTFENYSVLKEGWNLISIPLIQEIQDLYTVLQMIEGYYDAVQWYNISDPNDPWKHNKEGKPFGNDLFELNETMSFWIHITQPGDTIFIYNGTQPTQNQTIPLYPGWNMVGYPSLTNHNRTMGLNNLEFGVDVDTIQWYDASTKTWHFMDLDDVFSPGRGYWVHSRVETGWEVPL